MKYLLIVMILISTNVSAHNSFSEDIFGFHATTLGGNGVDIKVDAYPFHPKIARGINGIKRAVRNRVSTVHIESTPDSLCRAIAETLILTNVPVKTILMTITTTTTPPLPWKVRQCAVNPVVNITVD